MRPANARDELDRVDGLRDELIGARVDVEDRIAVPTHRRESKEIQLAEGLLASQRRADPSTVFAHERHVDEGEARNRIALREAYRALGVGRRPRREARSLERRREKRDHRRVSVCHQDGRRARFGRGHHHPRASGALRTELVLDATLPAPACCLCIRAGSLLRILRSARTSPSPTVGMCARACCRSVWWYACVLHCVTHSLREELGDPRRDARSRAMPSRSRWANTPRAVAA